jgi:hypothetical protein
LTTLHNSIVYQLHKWVIDYCALQGCCFSVYADHQGFVKTFQPPQIFQSIPDVMAISIDGSRIVIAEAETEKSLLTAHTERQIVEFLKYCSQYEHSIFIFAIPWVAKVRAIELLQSLKSARGHTHIKTQVVDTIGLSECQDFM